MRPWSITARLTLFFSAASAAVLLVFGHLVGTLVESHFEQQDLDELAGKLQLVRHALAKANATDGFASMQDELSDALVGHHGLSIVVQARDGGRLFASDEPSVAQALVANPVPDDGSGPLAPIVTEHAGRLYRAIVASVADASPGNGPAAVAVAMDISHHRDFLAQFHAQLWLSIATGVAIAALFGWLAAQRGLAPVRGMARIAQGVSARRLGDRLPAESFPRELTDLATAFNGMLARLEDSFRRLSEFSSDLAHELRTPISNLMTETQVALSKTRSADEYREVLYSNLEEHERLARTITDMLFLAHADHGLLVPSAGPVDLASEVRELFAFYDALAEERGIALSLQGEAVVRGDRLMIRRALSNLLSNAIRHTAAKGTVQVAIARGDDGTIRVAVENPGPTIEPEHLPRLFDRFYRVESSRTKVSEGAGLGLAITKSIVDAHQGALRVASADGRTRFEIAFPGDDAPGLDASRRSGDDATVIRQPLS
jgi:two-component system heavy metal sensor histidine kinase CusS